MDSRRFIDLRFGFSVSKPDFGEERTTLTEHYVERLVCQEASHILLEGGRLLLGHKWREKGMMEQLAERARELRSYRPRHQLAELRAEIMNIIAWPDRPPDANFPAAKIMIDRGILKVQQIVPEGIDVSHIDPESPLGEFCRLRALTAMRKELAAQSDLRFCLGGAGTKSKRRLPGIIEEAYFATKLKKPIYISSSLGGVSRVMADVLLQRHISDDEKAFFTTSTESLSRMHTYAPEYSFPLDEGPCVLNESNGQGWDCLAYFRSLDVAELAATAWMSLDEYINLLTTADIDRALTLMYAGASRVQENKTNPASNP